MTAPFIERLLEEQGLLPLVALRANQIVPTEERIGRPLEPLLERVDLLALGAAADRARREEGGAEVHVYVRGAAEPPAGLLVVGDAEPARGTALCRRIAAARLLGPIGRRIVIDFGALGIEIAQIALSFGATDLAGPIAPGRGLPLVDQDGARQLLKRRELAGKIERAGFSPVFVGLSEARAHASESAAATAAARPNKVDEAP